MNSKDVEAETVRCLIKYTGGGTRQGIVHTSSESDQDIRQLILKFNEMRHFDVKLNILAGRMLNLEKQKWKIRKQNEIGSMISRK